jgi:hypothetical protein
LPWDGCETRSPAVADQVSHETHLSPGDCSNVNGPGIYLYIPIIGELSGGVLPIAFVTDYDFEAGGGRKEVRTHCGIDCIVIGAVGYRLFR